MQGEGTLIPMYRNESNHMRLMRRVRSLWPPLAAVNLARHRECTHLHRCGLVCALPPES